MSLRETGNGVDFPKRGCRWQNRHTFCPPVHRSHLQIATPMPPHGYDGYAIMMSLPWSLVICGTPFYQ
jgi:hypothetical protein